jgi:DICT domain-containing protein
VGPVNGTPFDIVAGSRPPARTTKRGLLTTTRYLEAKATDTADPPVLLACFQDARWFGPHTAHRYSLLAKDAPFVAAFGTGFDAAPAPGVRGAALDPGDRLAMEWNVVVVGPYFSAALVARDLGDGGADRYRRFEYALTYERSIVIEAARSLLWRLGGTA